MRNPNRLWPWITIFLIFLPSTGVSQNTPDTRVLEPGKPIQRELAGDAVHAYSIQMTVGQFACQRH
jgi:hypothetical protein